MLFVSLRRPVFLSGKFDAGHLLSTTQQHDIIVCRLANEYGYSVEYILTLSLEWIGKLLSYKDGLSDIERGY